MRAKSSIIEVVGEYYLPMKEFEVPWEYLTMAMRSVIYAPVERVYYIDLWVTSVAL